MDAAQEYFTNQYMTASKFSATGKTRIAQIVNRNIRTLGILEENKASRCKKYFSNQSNWEKNKNLCSSMQAGCKNPKSSVNKDIFTIKETETSSQESSMIVSSQEMPCTSGSFCQEKAVSGLQEFSKAEVGRYRANTSGIRTVEVKDCISGCFGSSSENASNLCTLSNFYNSALRAEKANEFLLHKDSQNSVQSMEISSQGSLNSQKMDISSQETIMADNMNALEADKQNKAQLIQWFMKSRPIKNPLCKCLSKRKFLFWMHKREINVKRREIAVKKREVFLKKREMALVKREQAVKHYEKSLARRETSIISRENVLKDRELKILNYEAAIFSDF